MGLNTALHMTLNTAEQDIIDHRRQEVARLRLRGLTQRDIVAELARQNIVNPEPNAEGETGKPYSLGTINSDLKAITAEWRKAATQAIGTHRARQLAEVEEVRRVAWQGAGREDVVTALLKALEDDDPTVRRAAAQALGQVGMPDLTNILKALDQAGKLTGTPMPTKIAPTTPDGKALTITTITVVPPPDTAEDD